MRLRNKIPRNQLIVISLVSSETVFVNVGLRVMVYIMKGPSHTRSLTLFLLYFHFHTHKYYYFLSKFHLYLLLFIKDNLLLIERRVK